MKSEYGTPIPDDQMLVVRDCFDSGLGKKEIVKRLKLIFNVDYSINKLNKNMKLRGFGRNLKESFIAKKAYNLANFKLSIKKG